jgi:hypothetical protein
MVGEQLNACVSVNICPSSILLKITLNFLSWRFFLFRNNFYLKLSNTVNVSSILENLFFASLYSCSVLIKFNLWGEP